MTIRELIEKHGGRGPCWMALARKGVHIPVGTWNSWLLNGKHHREPSPWQAACLELVLSMGRPVSKVKPYDPEGQAKRALAVREALDKIEADRQGAGAGRLQEADGEGEEGAHP